MNEPELVALGRASAELAHELRNVLATIAVSARAAEADPAGAARFLARIGKHAELGQRLVDDVLMLATATSLVEREAIAASEILAAARTTLDTTVTFVDELEADAVAVHPGLFPRVLHALYANAVAVGATRIETRVHLTGADVAFDVTDDGPGVPADLRDRLFEPFATAREGGIGLGLSLARRITEAHGGRLTLLDRPGGTTFRIALPPPR